MESNSLRFMGAAHVFFPMSAHVSSLQSIFLFTTPDTLLPSYGSLIAYTRFRDVVNFGTMFREIEIAPCKELGRDLHVISHY
ncbi:Hypothetical protein NTJ_05832 [Nesidiocoris tenuis]|uniref:Uncharacterized protein n=1 Tax=Nesidiocoris tenuis TaxID=355587 RepID=A0ABN7AM48_9HEMI|nr:Hypothetical protein NTJ_05832 [Nesidiocoris tenuis]